MAAVDPYWGVLTHPGTKRGAWDRSAFFASGTEQIDQILTAARSLGLPQGWAAALDFGCGLGRLTRALSSRFTMAYGVDASGSLIDQARTLNGDIENCRFLRLTGDGLSLFEDGSLDLVCSFLVLQHQERQSAVRGYIKEFLRVLRPGGLAVFQMPTHIPVHNRIQPRRRAYGALRALGIPPSVLYNRLGLDPLRMQHMSGAEMLEAVNRSGGELLTSREDSLAGPYPSATYYVTKPAAAA